LKPQFDGGFSNVLDPDITDMGGANDVPEDRLDFTDFKEPNALGALTDMGDALTDVGGHGVDPSLIVEPLDGGCTNAVDADGADPNLIVESIDGGFSNSFFIPKTNLFLKTNFDGKTSSSV